MSSEKYISEEAESTYPIYTGLLGVLFLGAQFIVPFVAMIVVMPLMPMMGGISLVDVENSALHDGSLWYIVEKHEFRDNRKDKKDTTFTLHRFRTDSDKSSTHEPISLDMKNPRLLSNEEQLWILSSSEMAQVVDNKLTNRVQTNQLGNIRQHFIKDGSPAVVVSNPQSKQIMVFDGQQWSVETELPATDSDESDRCCMYTKLIHAGDTYYYFKEHEDSLFFRRDIPNVPLSKAGDWTPVVNDVDNWSVSTVNDRPLVSYVSEGNPFAPKIQGIQYDGKDWTDVFEVSGDRPMNDVNVFTSSTSDDLFVFGGGVGQNRLFRIQDGEVISEQTIGPSMFGSMFGGIMPVMMGVMYGGMALAPLVLAVILTWLMNAYRVQTYERDRRRRTYASLWRRAVAQLIDLLIVGAPHVFLFLYIFSNFAAGTFPVPGPWLVVPMFGGFVWWVLFLLIFSYLEGSTGQTPGKWITGIRVIGEDLSPCGFGRALLRNILKLVDGFFNYMVGIMMVALTTKWQRIGDMAAGTLVVQAGQEGVVPDTEEPSEPHQMEDE